MIQRRRLAAGSRVAGAAAIWSAVTVLATVALPGIASAMPLTCQAVSGHVRDGYGTPIAGATVDASAGNDCSPQYTAATDGTGAYTVYIEPSVSGTSARAARAGYHTVSRNLSVTSGSGNDFQLLYDLKPTPIPAWVKAGETISLTATTTASPPANFNGYLCVWGAHLGNGTTTSSSTPVAATDLSGFDELAKVAAMSASWDHGLAVRSDGSVVAWGANGHGQLGNGATADSATPVVVEGVGGVGTLSGVTAVAAGDGMSSALRSDGSVVTWGQNSAGQLGNGTTTDSATPVVVSGVGGVGTLGGVTSIATGWTDTLALRSDGSVVAWGDNSAGQLGNGTTSNAASPVVVSGVGGTGTLGMVTAVSAGDFASYALRGDGTVAAWGANGAGELGNGTTTSSSTPVVVSGVAGVGQLSGVTAVAGGWAHGLALRSDGSVVAWGYNAEGELGNGTTSGSTTPGVVAGVGGTGTLSGVTAVAAGGGADHSLALRADGSLVAWGTNWGGELGNGNTTNSSTPVVVWGVVGGQEEMSWRVHVDV